MPCSNLKPTDKSNHHTASTVSFKEFADLARRRSWTVDELAGRFAGRIDRPANFFARVLSNEFKDNVIPFRSVIEFYQAAIAGPQSTTRPTCACGCGRVVFDRKKWATPGCKKKAAREKVSDMQNRKVDVLDFVDARRGHNWRVGTLPSTDHKTGTTGL